MEHFVLNSFVQMINQISIAILVLFITLPSTIFAETDVGRLPDGRAYRVDEQGYQLVDYVAELELKIEELQTNIVALSNELRLQESSGIASDNDFGEKNLIPKREQKKEVITKIVKEQVMVPADCKLEVAACETQLLVSEESKQNYLKKLKQLESKNENLLAQLLANQDSKSDYLIKTKQLESKNENLLAQLNDQRDLLMASSNQGSQYQTKLTSLQSNLDNLHNKLNDKDLSISRLERLINQLEMEKQKQLNVLNEKDNDLSEIRGQLQIAINDKSSTQDKLQVAIVARDAAIKEAASSREVAAVKKENVSKPIAFVASTSHASSSYVGGSSQREKAFTHLQSRLALDLEKVATMIKERAKLSHKYEAVKSSRSVQVSLKPLSTKAGYTLQRLTNDLPRAAKFSHLGKIQKNIYELSKNVSSDISVLQRLLR